MTMLQKLLLLIMLVPMWAVELESLSLKELKAEAKDAGVPDDVIKKSKSKESLITEINLLTPADGFSFDTILEDPVPIIAALCAAILIGLLILNANGKDSSNVSVAEPVANEVDTSEEVAVEAEQETLKTVLSIPLNNGGRNKLVGLGLLYSDATSDKPKSMEINEVKGAAAEAGLQLKDRIVSINGKKCDHYSKDQFEAGFLRLKSDASVASIDLEVIRDPTLSTLKSS